MSHLLSSVLLLLLLLSSLPYIMREMAPNGFLLSISGAAVMLYIRPGLYGHIQAVQCVICFAAPTLENQTAGGKHTRRAHLNCFYECVHKSDFSPRLCVIVQRVCEHFQRVFVFVSFSLTDQKVLSGLLSSRRESCSYKFRRHGWKHNHLHQSHSWFAH